MDEAQRLARNYDNYVVHPPSECDLECSSNKNALVTLHVKNKVRTKNMFLASKQCHFYPGRSEYGRTPAKSKLQHNQMNIRARTTEKGYCFATKNGKAKLTAQKIDRNWWDTGGNFSLTCERRTVMGNYFFICSHKNSMPPFLSISRSQFAQPSAASISGGRWNSRPLRKKMRSLFGACKQGKLIRGNVMGQRDLHCLMPNFVSDPRKEVESRPYVSAKDLSALRLLSIPKFCHRLYDFFAPCDC